MEKRYQVFISSTFQDLQGARQEVSQALLRADCFPAGMELFPAADEGQFNFIKKVIDQSDYYIIISAGMYGSISPETGLSYTEMEYDYALETGKPIVRLLHEDPLGTLSGDSVEQTDKGKRALKKFQRKMKSSRLVALWNNSDQLGKEVVFALQDLKKTFPATGWARADRLSSEASLSKISEMREENDALHKKLARYEHTEFENTLERFVGELMLAEFARCEKKRYQPWDNQKTGFISVGGLVNRVDYQATGRMYKIEKKEFVTLLSFGFLYFDNYSSAVKFAMSSSTEMEDVENRILLPHESEEVETLVMSMEANMLISVLNDGEQLPRSIIDRGSYLSAYKWKIDVKFRRWLLMNLPRRIQLSKLKLLKTPPPTAPSPLP